MSKILIVEDEESIAELEKDYLELSGFEVEIENDGEAGKITFTNSESLVSMVIEKIRPDMPIQIAVTLP